MECDILWNGLTESERIRVVQTRNGRQVGDPFEIRAVGWRLPARPSLIRMRSPDIDDYHAGSNGILPEKYFGPPPLTAHLEWEPSPEKGVSCLLEVARADFPDDWRHEWLVESGRQPSVVSSDLGRYFFGATRVSSSTASSR